MRNRDSLVCLIIVRKLFKKGVLEIYDNEKKYYRTWWDVGVMIEKLYCGLFVRLLPPYAPATIYKPTKSPSDGEYFEHFWQTITWYNTLRRKGHDVNNKSAYEILIQLMKDYRL